jgi:MFS family permease
MPWSSRSPGSSGAIAALTRDERCQYLVLGAPALGLSLTVTTLAAYLPVLARTLTSSRTLIGALVGMEGFVGLLLPIWAGAASDRVETRLGRRLPFLLCSAPIAAASLALLPIGRSLLVMAVEVVVFYVAYFFYDAPYRALYSDLVPPAKSGRAQGIQGTFRAGGMGSALVGGALLLHLWAPLPYLVAATVLVVTTLITVLGLRGVASQSRPAANPNESARRRVWVLVRDHPDIRCFMITNVLWQLTEGGLKSFIVLYLTRGLHKSFTFSAGAMTVVAVAGLIGSPLAGSLADAYGAERVMRILLAIFGIGLWVPVFWRSTPVLLAVLPIVGVGGAMALSLPYTILMNRMPEGSHGASAGLFDVSNGAGTLLGPLVTGSAIDLLYPLFRSTEGYAAMWVVLGTSTLLSIVLMRPLRSDGEQRQRGESDAGRRRAASGGY